MKQCFCFGADNSVANMKFTQVANQGLILINDSLLASSQEHNLSHKRLLKQYCLISPLPNRETKYVNGCFGLTQM